VNPLLFAALVAILSVQPNLRIEIIDQPVKEIHALAGYVHYVEGDGAYGWLECTKGHVDRLVHNGNEGTFLHEALHGASCALTGKQDGSLLPHTPKTDDPEHEWVTYCYRNRSECIEIMGRVK
jgi:hypothetical protein